jgi:choline dehydrogenase-like flavoprotein
MAREVTVDDTGLATGVTYIDKATKRDNHVRARIVVPAASACESARILLNSKSSKFPQGWRIPAVSSASTDGLDRAWRDGIHPGTDGRRPAQR